VEILNAIIFVYFSDLLAITERMSTVKHKIPVMSGKGGVGKSTFSTQLSFALAEMDNEFFF